MDEKSEILNSFSKCVWLILIFPREHRLGAMADWGMSGAGLELWQEQLNNEMRWTLL